MSRPSASGTDLVKINFDIIEKCQSDFALDHVMIQSQESTSKLPHTVLKKKDSIRGQLQLMLVLVLLFVKQAALARYNLRIAFTS